ncbi:MAG: hypothetical protein ACOCRK_07565 [bacterium]
MLLNSKKLIVAAVFLAINQICLVLTSLIRFNTAILLIAASLVIGIVIFEYGIKIGVIFYISSSILSYFLVSDKMIVFNYALIFGLYSLVKNIIEQVTIDKNLWIELFAKLTYANTVLIIIFFLFNHLIGEFDYSFYVIIVIWEFAFWIYDYLFSLFIQFYLVNIRKRLPL